MTEPWRWGLATLAAVLVAISGWAVWWHVQGLAGGPLQVLHGGQMTVPGKIGQPYVWSTIVLSNPTEQTLTIDDVTVQTGPLSVKRLALGAPNHWPVGGVYPWPPTGSYPGSLLPPHDVALTRHGATQIFGELVMARPGRYPIGSAVTVDYHIGVVSYHKEAHLDADMLYAK
ncbi:MAG TPA: hypothetical protein VFL99_01075 [Segeticoccus sp.]|uniref:hypothetical protein n=1 Tax=Segeticoccus sp. TaxID=2706531 RepID=UPI002D8078E4|nr:hypothetical protein [Segeticoccus sp.]HET8598888.1 hypothetical protein [Segeticoccus sp.]